MPLPLVLCLRERRSTAAAQLDDVNETMAAGVAPDISLIGQSQLAVIVHVYTFNVNLKDCSVSKKEARYNGS